MAISASLTQNGSSDDTHAWKSLKRAISTSSGFQRWRQQSNEDGSRNETVSDQLVIEYLRETLETLAY
ncbi:MAG: hypothetical protein AAGA75_10160 [Cyanobacteria bacterium P01_E01_bin.6]